MINAKTTFHIAETYNGRTFREGREDKKLITEIFNKLVRTASVGNYEMLYKTDEPLPEDVINYFTTLGYKFELKRVYLSHQLGT